MLPGASKWIFAASLVALAVSLCANVLLIRQLQAGFQRLQLARIFPLGYAPDEKPRTAGSGDSIAFWGDSRAYFWDTSELARDHAVENFAHGAQTSSQLLLQLQSAPARHSSYAIVQIGINDLHPLGALESLKPQIVAALNANLIAIRDALLARSDRVVLTTIFPPGPVPLARRLSWDPQTLASIDAANRAIRGAADGKRVFVLDAYAVLRERDGLLAAQYTDPDFFLHVNRAAYARLNLELSHILAAQRYSK
jgi:lysophospholipase L1-like esterase